MVEMRSSIRLRTFARSVHWAALTTCSYHGLGSSQRWPLDPWLLYPQKEN